MASKKQYETPALTVVGTFESITQGNRTGSQLDATFPVGTGFNDLTFS